MPLNKTACTYALMHEYGANLTAAAVFWLGVLRAIQAQSLFRLVADKHDGLVLQRTRPKQLGVVELGVVELDVICRAAEGALRDVGVFTIMRLKYDADFGGAR